MKTQVSVWRALAAALCAILLLMAGLAYAEIPAASPQTTEGLAHRWVREQMGYAPYTEPAAAEAAAKAAAIKALSAPPQGLLAQADHGYPAAQATLRLANSLKRARPAIVGHELIIWNDEQAARIYVGRNGDTKLLDVGSVQELLVSSAIAASDSGDREALEVAQGTFDLAAALGTKTAAAKNGLVSAHVVGLADDDGSHLVARVGSDSVVTFPGW